MLWLSFVYMTVIAWLCCVVLCLLALAFGDDRITDPYRRQRDLLEADFT